jgi:hypothetical protein
MRKGKILANAHVISLIRNGRGVRPDAIGRAIAGWMRG